MRGSGTTISMNPLFGTVIPSLTAATFIGLYVWMLTQPKTKTVISNGAKLAWAILSGTVCAAVLGFFVRDSLRTLGAGLGGETRALEAAVERTRGSYGRGRCREFATFELSDERLVEICVRHAFRPDLIDSELGAWEPVTLIVKSNAVGDTVVRIIRRRSATPETS
jgi:hypothetical protein